MHTAITILVAGWFFIWCIIIIKRYSQEIALNWKEPVLKHPVLIFESDDWGAGPLKQTQALIRISASLTRYADQYGRHPCMTLGIVLSIPDPDKIKQAEFKNYFAKRLDHPVFSPVKTAILNGYEQGVFDLQLHGMAHYWPENLMRAIQADKHIRDWLDQEELPKTEKLPSWLQSRWTNTEHLPTKPLDQDQIDQAVREEVGLFKEIFGFKPQVAVPPTFIWNEAVESSWKQQSVAFLVTPGECFDRRNKNGKPSGTGQKIANGQLSESGLTYVVRNDYFEPSLGHTTEMAIKALTTKTKLAQPTLLEIHRFNFIENDEITENSLRELEKTISLSLAKYPNLMFFSTKELAENYVSSNKDLIEKSYGIRMLVCMERLWANHTIRKWLYLSGLFLPMLCLINFRK